MKTTLRFFMAAILFSSVMNSVAQNPLCIVGDATRYGWDKSKASPLTQDGVNPSKFYYAAYLKAGSFKFLWQNTDWVPSFQSDAGSSTVVVKRKTYADPDVSFSLATAGNYSIVLDTAALTLSMTPMTETNPIPFNTLFMVGGATPNGWDLGKATQLVRNPSNPFEFSYTGPMATGEFKFPINRDWGWGQDFFMKVSDTQMVLQNSPDSKWTIATAGNYTITLNVSTLAISIANATSTINPNVNQLIPSLQSTVVSNLLKVDNLSNFSYRIYNLTGEDVLKGTSGNGNINVESLKGGIYLLSVDNKTVKFIKQ